MIDHTQIERYMSLFRGNPRSYGQWNPKETDKNKDSWAKKNAYSTREVEKHLKGEMGLGLVPIMDDATCYWGAIDMDNHDTPGVDLDLKAIETKIAAMHIPLVVCRSKSGGAALFLFGREPLRCSQVHGMLTKWAKELAKTFGTAEKDGHGVDCIFPKQTKLARDDDGTMQLGNWLNLPYFNADDTPRYAIENGFALPFGLFLDKAESSAVTALDLDKLTSAEHTDAPPCIAQGIAEGIGSGSRNEFAYNLTLYMKKRFPEDFKDRIYDMNGNIFDTPLPFIEIKKVVQSASRREYKYKCNTEPCKSMCDRKVCLTRKFGISQGQADEMDAEFQIPVISELVKYMTNPVRWEITIEGHVIPVATEELMDWHLLRPRVVERLMRMVPMVKNDKWQKKLEPMLATCRVMDAPDDASTGGVIKSQLVEFFRKIDLTDPGTDTERRKDIDRGLPVVQLITAGRCVLFRGADFVTFLKRNRAEELRGVNLWFAMKEMGVKHDRFRVGDKTPTLWYIPVSDDHILQMETPTFESDI